MATKITKGDTPTEANRNQRRRQRTRETILAAADQVFRRKGIDGTTVNDITEQADVAYGSFYNHFKSIDEIVGALVAASLQRVADRTGSILEKAERVELLPCVGAGVIMRTLWQDPAIRWVLGRPYVFVDEFYKAATPFMVSSERQAVEAGVLRPAGGHEYWLKVFPWILIAELTARGHDAQKIRPFGINGCATAVLIDPASGNRIAGADRRRDCYAIAY